MNGISANDVLALLPIIVLTIGAIAVLMSEVFLVSGKRGYQAGLAVASAVLAAIAAIAVKAQGPVFGGQATVDAFSIFITVTVCLGAGVSSLVSAGWLEARNAERGEFHALVLFASAGMVLLGMASDYLVAFIGIEVMSLATYALSAYMRRGRRPAEAAFKYFILGSFSSALFIYGAALAYGATGTTLFSGASRGGGLLLVAGLGLIAAGLAFKVAAVPFHVWTPDVYEGAPTPTTAFMAAGVKTAAFAVLARVLVAAFANQSMPGHGAFGGALASLAILTMVFGNLLALTQRSVKRMLAYSSIAHAGYLLMGIWAAGVTESRELALTGVLFYLAAYTATVIGAFAVVGTTERRGAPDEEPGDAWDLARFAGLSRRRPGLAFAMAVFLLSLAGIPPTAGFVAKLLIFKAALGAHAYGLAIIGIVTSALGAYYYLRVIVYMYMRPTEGAEDVIASPALSLGLALAAIAVVVLGIGPEPIASLARVASTSF
ncbi:MAG TPA: NADH-quinone oxidoreductase subunit N [Anaeromyxobacteraceae bacterium]|nr:NADH-quinone oxidoreductase subunit N [Anaeromyxobacteraceae bacterium]